MIGATLLAFVCALLAYQCGRWDERKVAIWKAIQDQRQQEADREAEAARQRHQAIMAAAFTLKFAQRTGHQCELMPVNQFVRHLSKMSAELVGSN